MTKPKAWEPVKRRPKKIRVGSPKYFDKIEAGLKDAIAFAKGDKSKGRVTEFPAAPVKRPGAKILYDNTPTGKADNKIAEAKAAERAKKKRAKARKVKKAEAKKPVRKSVPKRKKRAAALDAKRDRTLYHRQYARKRRKSLTKRVLP